MGIRPLSVEFEQYFISPIPFVSFDSIDHLPSNRGLLSSTLLIAHPVANFGLDRNFVLRPLRLSYTKPPTFRTTHYSEPSW